MDPYPWDLESSSRPTLDPKLLLKHSPSRVALDGSERGLVPIQGKLCLSSKDRLDRSTNKPEIHKRKVTTKTRVEIHEIETKRTIEKISRTKSWFWAKTNTTGKPLARFSKKKES